MFDTHASMVIVVNGLRSEELGTSTYFVLVEDDDTSHAPNGWPTAAAVERKTATHNANQIDAE
ncbi:MAG TPA: hypothetical protein VIZ58_02430 [Thermoanaerobaculia bacterium]